MTQDTSVPRFCPKGCGETVIASKLTDVEWSALHSKHPNCIREKSWHIKCIKCGHQAYIGRFN